MFIDEAAEFRLLGAAVDDPDLLLYITEEVFTGERIAVYRSMKSAYTTYGELSSEGVERFFGRELPPEVDAGRGAKPEAIIDKLVQLATKRQVIKITDSVARLLTQQEIDRNLLLKALSLPPILTREDSSLLPGINGFLTDWHQKHSGQYRFIDTGLPFLNLMLDNEWPRQALTVVLGQAGGGKTALVCQSILNMARQGIPALFISLEMPKARLIPRFLAYMTKIDSRLIRSGKLDANEQIDAALAELQTLPIYIVHKPGMTVDEIVYQVKLHKELYNIEAFFVDYLQIVGMKNVGDNLAEALGDVSLRIRNAAIDSDTAAIALSQQNRQHKGLASILNSGRISQIADTVFEIIFDASSTNDESRVCELTFLKNRDGPVGSSTCFYRPRYMAFE